MTESLSQKLLARARIILKEAEQSFAETHWDRCLRKCHEALELQLKGLIRSRGIEPAKTHELSDLAAVLWANLDPETIEKLDHLTEQRIEVFYNEGLDCDRDAANDALLLARHFLAKQIG